MANPTVRNNTDRRMRLVVSALDVMLAIAAVAAVATLVLEHGFRKPVIDAGLLRFAQLVVVLIFVLDRLARLAIAPGKLAYVRENIVDFGLMAVAAAVLAINLKTALRAGALYVTVTQAYILVALLLRAVSLNLLFAGSGIHPGWLLVGSFLFMILVGSGLLMLPVSVRPEYYDRWFYGDALFTATSATCVTGLVVVNTGGHFTMFGQAVILALIQCGGLGIMLFGTVLGLLIGKSLTTRQSETIGQMVSAEGIGRLARIAMFVIAITFALELLGAIALHPMFSGALDTRGRPLTPALAVWHSVFHSVSAFCNAGFALYGNNMMQGVREGWDGSLRDHWQIFGVMAPLIVLGGLGFPVLANCAGWALSRAKRLAAWFRSSRSVLPSMPPVQTLTLHTKIVLTVSLALIVVGACVLLLVEPRGNGDWPGMSIGGRIGHALFQSITARTAGFNTVSMSELSNAGKLWMCLLMIIGGSPASTAGGMKTATFALLVLVVVSQLRRRTEVEIFNRSVPSHIVARAVTIGVLYLTLVTVITILLSVAQGPGFRFIDVLFEACSACGTVGLSTGITKSLSPFGKWVIIAGMFIGRLGPLTLLAALTSRIRRVEYTYPAEGVTIG